MHDCYLIDMETIEYILLSAIVVLAAITFVAIITDIGNTKR